MEGQGEAVLWKNVDVVLVLLFGWIQAGLDGIQILRVSLYRGSNTVSALLVY